MSTKTQADFAQFDPREVYSPEDDFGESTDEDLANIATATNTNKQEGR